MVQAATEVVCLARVAWAGSVYEAAQLFREKCLGDGMSLLWPDAQAWTAQNVGALWEAFVGNPDEGNRPFLEKWHDQLSDESDDVHRVAVDLLAFYYLFPSNIGRPRKLEVAEEVAGWKLENDPPDLGLLERTYASSIGNAGTQHTRSMPWQLSLYLEFFQQVRNGEVNPMNREACQRAADTLRARWGGRSGAARSILLHLFFPERYERISAENHKRKIVEAFADRVGDARDEDEALLNIRGSLEEELGRDDDFDFYDNDVEPLWNPVGEKDTEETGSRFWVEKTIVHGRSDREGGDYALGKALWSPQRSKSGGDVYRFLREVEPGDIVLHLTDNRAFTGVSRAAGPYEEFGACPAPSGGKGPPTWSGSKITLPSTRRSSAKSFCRPCTESGSRRS